MKLLSPIKPPVYNLLSLGERGVGKTVFLVGSYAELNSVSDIDPALSPTLNPSLWFECQYNPEKELLESILNYVAQTGHYPPPTLKITDFHFAFKQRQRWGIQTLCYFRWWDIPGEYCNFENPYYQTMVLNSHSCCVFINADRLVHDPTYSESLDTITKQVISLARLIDRNALPYGFALIFTQCDRLSAGAMGQLQIEEKIQGLIGELESVSAKYQRFYSGVPIVEKEGVFKLQSNGVSSAFLWLVAELYKKQVFGGSKTLESSLKAKPSPNKLLPAIPPIALWVLGALGLIGAILLGGQFFSNQPRIEPTATNSQNTDQQIEKYQALIDKNPNNLDALVALANLYLEQGQLEKAIPALEKIVTLQPKNLDWQFNLAKLYELAEQNDKAEKIYDDMLAKDNKQFKALVGKAIIRQSKGDFQTANSLLKIAEQVAPSPDLKKKIQELAKNQPPK
ncbi:MAG: tetratricopeptide repeat protein [Snowella sp.]|nr:tetratricopeptide repeat protein [Snowella sp.]